MLPWPVSGLILRVYTVDSDVLTICFLKVLFGGGTWAAFKFVVDSL